MRRATTWVVMQTSPRGEEEARLGTLAKRLNRISGIDIENIYVPVLRSGSTKATFLIEGYIFIKSGYPSARYYEMARSPFIEKMISQYDKRSDMISQGTVLDRDLKNMVAEAYKLGGNYKEGDKVTISEGDFKGCDGVVQTVIKGEGAFDEGFYAVLLSLRSAEVIVVVDIFSVGDFDG